jgi:tetratricopeptide (TPR) repeat protein
MYCQTCGARNPDDEEFCARCHSKLLILSGVGVVEEGSEAPEEIPFDEHLLERISTLEDVVKRTGEAVKTLFETIGNLEKNLFVAHTGVLALQETLERGGVVRSEEVLDLWETKMDERMQAVEKKDRFLERRDRIMSRFPGEDREGFVRRLSEAEFAILALDADRGVRMLEDLSRLDRGNVELAFYLAETFFSGGDLERAAGYFKRILAVESNHFESLVYSGIAASESGETEAAESLLNRAVERKPEAILPHFALGALYANGARWDEAEEALSRAIDVASVASAHVLLGTVLRAEGKTREAIRFVRDFLEKHPSKTSRAVAYYELATTLAESDEDLDSALDYAGRALAEAPDELKPYPLAAMGWVHYKRKEFDRAIDCLRRSSERAAQPTTFHHLGMAYLAAGKPEEAKAAFTRAKTVARGGSLEDRMLRQVRSNIRFVEKFVRKKESPPARKE